MNESNDNFGELKRLLKLKQHEVPPPGYFNNFSGGVISRIRNGEASRSQTTALDRFDSKSWLVNWLQVFQARPGLIGGFATALCLLLVAGVVLVDNQDGASVTAGTSSFADAPAVPADASAAMASSVSLLPPTEGIAMSTNPVTSLQPVATLFNSQQNPLFQQAGFVSGQ
jgi:hypothetical protein